MILPVLAIVAAAQPGADPALIKQLEEIDAKAAAIKDLTADFEQTKHTALLREPMVSWGTVRVRGAVVRWETTKPRPSVVRIDEKEIRIYYPEEKALEVYTLDEQLRRLTSSPIPRLKSTREQFEISAAKASEIESAEAGASTVAIRLTPREEGLRRHVREVLVLIDSSSGLALRLQMTDADGDKTVIAFLHPRINAGVTEQEVGLAVPAGTRVSHPLEGMERGAERGGGK